MPSPDITSIDDLLAALYFEQWNCWAVLRCYEVADNRPVVQQYHQSSYSCRTDVTTIDVLSTVAAEAIRARYVQGIVEWGRKSDVEWMLTESGKQLARQVIAKRKSAGSPLRVIEDRDPGDEDGRQS